MGLFSLERLKEFVFDVGEYYKSVGKALTNILSGVGQTVGTAAGGLAGGAVGGALREFFNRVWFWLILAAIIAVAWILFGRRLFLK